MTPLLDDEEPEEPAKAVSSSDVFLVLLTSHKARAISDQLTSVKGDLETRVKRGLTFQKGGRRHVRLGWSRSC